MRTSAPAVVALGAAGWPGIYDRWWQERGRGGLESIVLHHRSCDRDR